MDLSEVADMTKVEPLIDNKPVALIPLPPEPEEEEQQAAEEGVEEEEALEEVEPPSIRAEACRLSNNSLLSLSGLSDAMELLLVAPLANIRWLDLSSNKLTTVSEELVKFPHLRTLNLHDNQLESFREIRKLSSLANLKNLTMHGNPIEEKKHYRMYTITMMPALNKLDFSMVTGRDRASAASWASTFRRRLDPTLP